jgi:GT2 family glycosyltransferase
MDTMPRVSIIILNWNGWKDTIECLESVYQITYPNYDVIVVDNGSENESIDKIKEYAEGELEVISTFFKYSGENKPLRYIEYTREEAEAGGGREAEIAGLPSRKKFILIKNGKNYGFAEGNNIVISYAMKALSPEYILLLNNDTVVDKAFLDELVKVAESDTNIGFVGPKTYYYDYHGRTDVINFAGGMIVMWMGKSAHIGLKEVDQGQYDAITDVDYVEGSCLLARRKTLETVGLLDPAYFLYWEEADWCMRAQKAGFKLLYAPKSKIWHKVSASNSPRTNPMKHYYITRNRSWFVMQNGTEIRRIGYLIYLFAYLLLFKIAASVIYYRDIEMCKCIIKGFIDGFGWKYPREL